MPRQNEGDALPELPSDRADGLHRQALVVDSMAGGPGVYSQEMLAEIEQALVLESTAELFREIERIQTAAYCAGRYEAYWAAIRAAGVDALSISVGAWGDEAFSFRGAVQDLGEWHRRFQAEPRFRLVRHPEDIRIAKTDGQLGVLLGFQNSTQLERDLRNVEVFSGLGVQMIQLTYNGSNEAGSGCTSPSDEGLTAFGRELVHVMNELGVVVDVSHCGPRTTMDAIRCSARPVAVSHSACSSVHAHPRNKGDEVLRALVDTGGYFGVCAVPTFLASREELPSLGHWVRHLQHAVEVCGADHVGIGTDWGAACSPPGVTRRLQAEARARGLTGSHELDFKRRTLGFETWSTGLPAMTSELLRAGLSMTEVEAIIGANFLQFYESVLTKPR